MNLLRIDFGTLGLPEPEPARASNAWRLFATCKQEDPRTCDLFSQIRAMKDQRDQKAALAALYKLIQVAASGLPLTQFYDKKQCHDIHSFYHCGRLRTVWRIRHGDIRLAFYYGENRIIFLPLAFPKREGKLTIKQKTIFEAAIKAFVDAEAEGKLRLISAEGK